MNNDDDDDLPTAITRLLRNVDGVHTIYATRSLVPTVVSAVVEAVRNDSVGMHLVTVSGEGDAREIVTNIGITEDEPAAVVCRRAFAAIRDFFTERGEPAPAKISVKVGRVG